ncbi:hypothetical protein BDQ17DRAFT_1349943 [Cyathus striatus]|nr:hypothetical protein BDQ17DRAFT_1349943 [Cyathus striatus]
MSERSLLQFMYLHVVGLVLTAGYGVATFTLCLLGHTTASHILDFFGVLISLLVYWLHRYDRYLQGRQQST